MLELSQSKKHKISLSDYNSQQDIENRILLSDFTPFDVKVIEELLFSPLKISTKKLARSLSVEEEELLPTLHKLSHQHSKCNLLTIEGDSIAVDKEMRKHFEFQVQRFDPEFKPDMEFLQALLRKIPIHLLPTWYSIPRSTNNIFESIVEKYLLTPQTFQRYLAELHFSDPIIQNFVKDLFSSPDCTLYSSDVIAKYNLSRPNFEEIMLLLEYHFICAIRYIEDDGHWVEIVTPFYEWHQYLRFLRETEAPKIQAPVQRERESEFAFVEDVAAVLKSLQKTQPPANDYFTHLMDKLCLLRLATQTDGRYHALPAADEFLAMDLQNRALFLYRHPFNRISKYPLSPDLEPHLREAEKSIRRALHGGWVFFDDFVRGAIIPFNTDSVATLKKSGKTWKYTLPTYSEAEKQLLKASIFESLFESGMVAIGTCQDRDCFAVTPFGRFFFEDVFSTIV